MKKFKTKPAIVTYVEEFVQEADGKARPYIVSGILNREYLRGNQHKRVSKRLEIVEKKFSKDVYTEKKIFNRMLPIYATRYGILSSNMPVPGFKASTNRTTSISGSQEGNAYIQNFNKEVGIQKKYSKLIQLADIDAIAWIKTGMDWSKGDLIGTIDVENDGVKGEMRVHEGRPFIDVVPMHEVFVRELKIDSMEDINELVHRRIFSCDYIESRFGIRPEPQAAATHASYPYYSELGATMSKERSSQLAYVTEYYKKADAQFPNGRYVLLVGDKVKYDGDLPFINGKDDKRHIPFDFVNLQSIPGHMVGVSIYNQIIPMQDTYNTVKNRLLEYVNHLAIGQLYIREGSLVNPNAFTNKPGKMIRLKRNGRAPETVRKERVGNEITQYLRGLEEDMLITAGLSAMQAFGQSKSNMRTDGVVDKIADADSNKLTNAIENLSAMLISAYKKILYMEKDRYRVLTEEYEFALPYDDMVKYKVRDTDPSELTIVNREFLMQSDVILDKKLMQANQLGLYNPQLGLSYRTKREFLEATNSGYLQDTLDPIERANFENVESEHEDLWQDIEISVESYQDHNLHIVEHNLFRMSSKFRDLKKQDVEQYNKINKTLSDHIAQHQQYVQETQQQSNTNAKAFI